MKSLEKFFVSVYHIITINYWNYSAQAEPVTQGKD